MTNDMDSDLQHDVLDELEWDPSVNAAEIGVAVQEGIVTLTGFVDSYSEKIAALEATHRVIGVKAVADEVHVRIPVDSTRTDAEIAQASVNSLKWNASVPRNSVDVTVSDGHVHLQGAVDWQFQKAAAEEAVRYLRGVTGVSNAITIKTRPKAQDIQTRIENAFLRSAEVDAQHIQVETLDGQVTLYGTVRSWTERKEAERAAWAAPGVSDVDNKIVLTM